MQRFISSIVLMCLIAPGAAFAGQGIVVERSPGTWYSYAEKLPIGATVRIRTTDGKRHTAVLALVDRGGITVGAEVAHPRARAPDFVRSDSTARAEDKWIEHRESSGRRLRHWSGHVPRAVSAGLFELGLNELTAFSRYSIAFLRSRAGLTPGSVHWKPHVWQRQR